MIASHQPVFFPSSVKVTFSSVNDGSMRFPSKEPAAAAVMQSWLPSVGVSTHDTNGILVEYGPHNSYDVVTEIMSDRERSSIVDRAGWTESDALFTTLPNCALLLPVADCIATVVHDPVTGVLGVLHLGRHSSMAHLVEAFASEVSSAHGSTPTDWRVWMSPSLQKPSNVMEYFTPDDPNEWSEFAERRDDGTTLVDIPAHNRRRFELIGVIPENIEVSSVDTYTDERYFSHRAAVDKNMPDRDGRMVVVAQMVEPGEPVV